MHDRTPGALEILFDPTLTSPAPPTPLKVGSARFWRCPNLIDRVVCGLDFGVFSAILDSGKWSGSPDDLIRVIAPYSLRQPFDLPIREAVDWVHASIYTTIKAMKFSHLAPVCGGSIELAVITSDRLFRWVRHKRFDSAILEGGDSNA